MIVYPVALDAASLVPFLDLEGCDRFVRLILRPSTSRDHETGADGKNHGYCCIQRNLPSDHKYTYEQVLAPAASILNQAATSEAD